MKKMTKFLCLALALVMCFGIVACKKTNDDPKDTGSSEDGTTNNKTPINTPEDIQKILDEYLPISGDAVADLDAATLENRKIYRTVLGEFYATYLLAESTKTTSEKFALMAIAEAKLLESGTLMPQTSRGGNYAISRVVPYTSTPILWGNDSDRFYKTLVVSGDPITAADREELKTLYKNAASEVDYFTKAREFLSKKGYQLTDKYNMGYSSNPQTWDVLATSQSGDTEALVNTYDGLVEYDVKNNLQPALAKSWTVSDDGLTYTFKLREGVMWVDAQGRELGELTAEDFVAGMQHMMDAKEGLEYLIEGIIKNASEYMSKEITDMSLVGVKAVDKYTLVYTLEQETSYFMTMLGYGCFAPLCKNYYVSKGGKFGAEYDPSADGYSYGKSYSDIAYCGPYTVSNYTENATIVFQANEKYWNKDAVNVKTLTWLYNDGTEALKAYNDMKSGTLSGCGLNASAVEQAKTDKKGDKTWFEQFSYVSGVDATSYMGFLNVNRVAYANFNDSTKVVSSMTDSDKERASKALLNQHFRTAIMYSLDRAAYNAQAVGEDLKLASLINSYTPGNFVKLEEEVTVQIGSEVKTYPAGTYYGAILQDQITADGYKYKVWDPEADGGNGSSSGFDGWHNVEEAKKELEKAIEELDIEVTKENPIKLDLPYSADNAIYLNRAQAFKQSLESALDGKVVLNLVKCEKRVEMLYAGYYITSGDQANYSIYDFSGWGPDYGDPATYLNTFLPEGEGYMTKSIGLY